MRHSLGVQTVCCPNCGNQIEGGAGVCPLCGSAARLAVKRRPAMTPIYDAMPKRKRQIPWLTLLIVAVVLAAVVYVLVPNDAANMATRMISL